MRPATIAGLSLLLLASAVVAVEFSEAAASKLPGENKVDFSEADASNLSDEELEALQEEFAVYGKYCGPGYCGGKDVAEGPLCPFSVKPKDDLDACCQVHDRCCGTPSLRSQKCNQDVLACVEKAKCRSRSCMVAKDLVLKPAFKLAKDKVCGEILKKSPEVSVANAASSKSSSSKSSGSKSSSSRSVSGSKSSSSSKGSSSSSRNSRMKEQHHKLHVDVRKEWRRYRFLKQALRNAVKLAASEKLLRAARQQHRTSDDDDGDRRPSFHEFRGARRHRRTHDDDDDDYRHPSLHRRQRDSYRRRVIYRRNDLPQPCRSNRIYHQARHSIEICISVLQKQLRSSELALQLI